MAESPKTEMLDVSKLTGDGMDVTLVITVPGQGAKRYPMRAASMKVGRSDQVDITVKDASVSSKHCDFVKENGRLFIRDTGSSNGTWMHEERITEVELQDGDVVRLGSNATVQIEIVGAGSAPRRAPPAAEEPAPPSSTMMISADDLDAMRSGAAPPPPPKPAPRRAPPPEPMPIPRRPAPMPPPRMEEEPVLESDGSRKTLIIAVAAALVVVLLGGVGVFFVLRSRAQADLELVERIGRDLAVLQQSNPCASVQDSVSVLIRLDQNAGVSTPTLPARYAMRNSYAKFVEVQRDKSNQYKRIAGSVEQGLAPAGTLAETVRATAGKLQAEELKTAAAALMEAVDARLAAGKSFAQAWKKIQGETEELAELTEAVFVKGRSAQTNAFQSFKFAKQAPQILGGCKRDHEASRKALEEKLAALKTAAAQ